jgi:hypothetical protein
MFLHYKCKNLRRQDLEEGVVKVVLTWQTFPVRISSTSVLVVVVVV